MPIGGGGAYNLDDIPIGGNNNMQPGDDERPVGGNKGYNLDNLEELE